MKQAISYVRFSSDRQKHGSSIERQEGMIADWLTKHPGYAVSDLKFSDLGKSGYHGEHIKEAGGFGKLLKALEDGFIRAGDVVLVEAIDRTGRLEPMDMLTLVINPILKAGVSIITLDDNTTYSQASVNTAQIFLLVAKIQAAHGYSAALSARVADSYKKRRKDAAQLGIVPRRITPVWLNPDGTERPDVVPWIKKAFEMYVDGMGKAMIAKRMRESGVERLAKSSGPGVEGWLRNKAVIGKWETLEGTPAHQIIDDIYPVIIEPSLFYKAQVHAEKLKTQRPIRTANHFLVGLVRCGGCDKNYIFQNKDGKPHSMRCRTRQSQNECINSHCVPKPVLDTIYRQTSMTAAMEALQQQQMGVDEKEIVTREAELLAIAKRIDGLVEALTQTGPIPEVIQALKQSRIEREAAENALVILKSTVISPAGEYWSGVGKVWDLATDDAQRLSAMLRNVGYHITVKPSGEITSSHSEVLYRYIGVDRALDMYKLLADGKLIMIRKPYVADYPYQEAFKDVGSENTWDEADYENLRLQYE